MTCTAEEIADEVLGLDESRGSSICNDSFNNSCVTDSEILEKTLPPGTAPKGFMLLDEVLTINESLQHLDSPQSKPSEPIFKVMFKNESIARKYSKRIRKFMIDLISSKVDDENDNADLILEVWESEAIGRSCSTVEESDGEIEESSLFTIDTDPKFSDDFDIPTYGKRFKKPLEKSTENENSEAKGDRCPKLTCFNCLGNHNLRDCKEARNYNNINKNRKEFSMKQANKNLRYHHDDDQKFGHLIPGQLSSNLKKALGLKENELPRHIYRMRTLGYPPGWLDEARLQHSGLTLFNSDGVAEVDPDIELGEIVLAGDRDKFDFTKIIDFPGFNVAVLKGIRDEERHYWGSHKQIENSKSTLLMQLSGKKTDDGYKRKKLKRNFSTSSSSEIIPSEMEIDYIEAESVVETVPVNGLFVPPLPIDEVMNPPEPPPLSNEDSDCQSQETLTPQSMNCSTTPSSPSNSQTTSDSEAAVPTQNTPISKRNVKSIDLGTPILQSTSPYCKLPSSEKFSKNICDVINFENLPDATGKYEQMSDIIQKVRCTLAEIHKD